MTDRETERRTDRRSHREVSLQKQVFPIIAQLQYFSPPFIGSIPCSVPLLFALFVKFLVVVQISVQALVLKMYSSEHFTLINEMKGS